jgi:tetratricopeptide (TPR) repeat protein
MSIGVRGWSVQIHPPAGDFFGRYNAPWQREFAVALANLADLLAKGHPDEALQIVHKSFVITEKLAQVDPANAMWQLDLALSYLRLAHLRRNTGNYGNAVSFYQKAIATIRRLSSANPTFAFFQRELANALDSLATLQTQRHKYRARETIRESVQILSRLVQQHPDHARWIKDLEIAKQHFEELHGKSS